MSVNITEHEESRCGWEREIRRPTIPVTTRKLSRFPSHPFCTVDSRAQKVITLPGVVLALQRVDRGKKRAAGVAVPPATWRDRETIKGRRGAVSPCMIMRCNLRRTEGTTRKGRRG